MLKDFIQGVLDECLGELMKGVLVTPAAGGRKSITLSSPHSKAAVPE